MPPKGFKHTSETKNKISQSLSGRLLSAETKNKMSLSKKGHPFYGRRNYRMSTEAKENIKKGIMKKRQTEEYLTKLASAKQGESNPGAKVKEKDVLFIRRKYSELICQMKKTDAQNLLAKEFGIKRATVSDIVLKRTWKHL
ncbi:hypothetical protein LUM37_02785 [Bacillus subtilis]|nr:hypothetical protein LUM37_02785 [Bacillus subtilis]